MGNGGFDIPLWTMLGYNNQLKFFDDYILKNKQRTLIKWICSEKLFKPGLSSPLSIQFPSQETIAEGVKLKPWERNIKQEEN